MTGGAQWVLPSTGVPAGVTIDTTKVTLTSPALTAIGNHQLILTGPLVSNPSLDLTAVTSVSMKIVIDIRCKISAITSATTLAAVSYTLGATFTP